MTQGRGTLQQRRMRAYVDPGVSMSGRPPGPTSVQARATAPTVARRSAIADRIGLNRGSATVQQRFLRGYPTGRASLGVDLVEHGSKPVGHDFFVPGA